MHMTVTGAMRSTFFGCRRIANADHLYGLSAECGLKAVLIAEGQPIEKPYRDHINKLWPHFVTFANRRRGSAHLAMLPDGKPFGNWDVNQRYAHQSHIEQAQVELHRCAARAVRAMLQHAIQDGRP